MSEHRATVLWQLGAGEAFTKNRYSRAHSWRFDGGIELRASASPHVVRAPWSDAAAVDPEEAFVASVSSCHMLWFLSLAAAAGLEIARYEDEAVGRMAEIAPQRLAIVEVVLRPRIEVGSARAPAAGELDALHHAAHENCFIANSVKTQIRVEPR